MNVTILKAGTTVRRSRRSKYHKLLAAMVESLRRDGADGQLRALDETAAWSPAKVRRFASGLRIHYTTHMVPGFRLSLRRCAVNGITFIWVPMP